ncbi:MAG: 4-(cytidine 5'-diphospho)-2-C-methyl-D-erythritol kinase [Planctomycetes bacterium]|nr:4-(cytidine 5'-diphospho)-2-C-methyl-D-erythritol kinase [Planctomycetota bacterium]
MKKLLINSPAKVNLFLEVIGKRPDGYHELETVMQEISLCDRLQLRQINRGVRIKTDYPGLPIGSSNLVYKAAILLQKRYDIKKGVEITISKKIPVGGGLGGGSSNAAYTLKGLNKLWNLGLSQLELAILAREIGSDVPFFIYGKTALCKGRGEIVFPLQNPSQFRYLIVYPGVSVPTKKIYQNLIFRLTKRKLFCKLLASNQPVYGQGMNMFNRLEETTLALYPVLRGVKREMMSCGIEKAMLCGSGSCFLGIVYTAKEVRKALKRFSENKILSRATVFHARSIL